LQRLIIVLYLCVQKELKLFCTKKDIPKVDDKNGKANIYKIEIKIVV